MPADCSVSERLLQMETLSQAVSHRLRHALVGVTNRTRAFGEIRSWVRESCRGHRKIAQACGSCYWMGTTHPAEWQDCRLPMLGFYYA